MDRFETPGYREWEAFELRTLLLKCSLAPEGDGLWKDSADEIWVMVSPMGLFVGWNNSQARLPAEPIQLFGDVRHLPRGGEAELPETIQELSKLRLAAMTQCRHCGEMFTPGWISERCCFGCMSDVHGIVF